MIRYDSGRVPIRAHRRTPPRLALLEQMPKGEIRLEVIALNGDRRNVTVGRLGNLREWVGCGWVMLCL